MELQEVILDSAVKIAIAVIPILAAIVTRYVVKVLKAKEIELQKAGKEADLALLHTFSELAVMTAEQILDGNEAKYGFATKELLRLANEAGIPITYQDSQLLIESTVKSIKGEIPELNGDLPMIIQGEVLSMEEPTDGCSNS